MNIKMRTALKPILSAIILLLFIRLLRELPYMDTKTTWNCYDITDIPRNCHDIFPYMEYNC